MRYIAEISYDGSSFHGWQRQDNALTIQEELEKSLEPLVGKPTKIHGCGRTDTGVHAEQYFFHFDAALSKPENCVYSLNQIVDRAIAIKNIWQIYEGTHARFDAQSRSYRYNIHHQKDPFLQKTSWFFQRNLDVDKMNSACEVLLNYNDFGAFCKSNADNKTNLCSVYKAEWIREGHQLFFDIDANRFLRNMVRAIVGTMLEIGIGNMNLDQFIAVIESKDRQEAGFSVPAHGLFLKKVNYDTENWILVEQNAKK
jgi:tRNA pseudouridine38-40 synthase